MNSATAKNSAMAIAAGLIWRAIFVFIGIRFYLFLRENFPSVAEFFEIRNSVEDYLGSRHDRKQKQTIEPTSRLTRSSECCRALIIVARDRCRAARALPWDGAEDRWVLPVEDAWR